MKNMSIRPAIDKINKIHNEKYVHQTCNDLAYIARETNIATKCGIFKTVTPTSIT